MFHVRRRWLSHVVSVLVAAGLLFQCGNSFVSAFQLANGPLEGVPFGSPPPREDAKEGKARQRDRPAATDVRAAGAEATAIDADGQKKTGKVQAALAAYAPSPAEARIREEFSSQTDLELSEVPLKDAVEFLKDRHGIEIQIDQKALTDAGVASDELVTINVKGISLRSALRLMLSGLSEEATFVVADEVLLITTRDGAARRKSIRIYNVSDFVEPQPIVDHDPFGAPFARPPGPGFGGAYNGLGGVVNVIQQAIAPGTWGAEHDAAVVPLVHKDTALLVVRHSANVHDDIVDLLDSLREVQSGKRSAK